MANENSPQGSGAMMADPLEGVSQAESDAGRRLLGILIRTMRAHKGADWYREPGWDLDVRIVIESRLPLYEATDRLADRLHALSKEGFASQPPESRQNDKLSIEIEHLLSDFRERKRHDMMSPSLRPEGSSLDDQLAREHANPTEMTDAQKKEQQRRHKALAKTWRADQVGS